MKKFFDLFRIKLSAIPGIMKAEYKLLFSDLAAVLLCFGVQLLYPFVYPAGFYDRHDVVRNIPAAAVDLDRSRTSSEFIRMIDSTEYVNITSRPESFEAARKMFSAGEINGIAVIPDHFEKDILTGKKVTVQIYSDASLFYIYKQVYSSVQTAASYLGAGIQIQRFEAGGMSELQAETARAPLRQVSIPLYNPSASYVIYLLPGILLLILHQTLLMTTGILGGMRKERGLVNTGEEERCGEASVLLGRVGAVLLVYLVHVLFFFGPCWVFHGLTMKCSLFLLVIFLFPVFLSAGMLAAFIACFIRTKETAVMFFLWSSIPVLFMSGYSWPHFAMPAGIAAFAHLIPATPGLNGLLKMAVYGASFGDVLGHWFNAWILAAVYFTAALIVKRRKRRTL